MKSPARQEAVYEILELMKRHGITVADLSSALSQPASEREAEKSSSILSRLFGYIGGIFVFAGLAIYVGMRWEMLDSAGRILITLGPGFCAFVMALVCSTDARWERAATPLFLVAAVLQPTGILVMMQELSRGGDPAYGWLFMNGVMLVQQLCGFIARRRTVLAFTSMVFALGFCAVAFDLLQMGPRLIGMSLGFSTLCVAWALGQSRHQAIAGFWYFMGAVIFLAATYDWLHHTAVEIFFLGLTCAVIFLSTLARSRSLLLVGTLAMIGYIGEFMARHFADNLNAPLMLMLMGFVLIVIGVLAVKINNRYIREAGH